jgi:hypothetical protein
MRPVAIVARMDPVPCSAHFPDAQDAVDHAGIRNKRYDAHAAATHAQDGIGFEDFLIRRTHVLWDSREPSEWSCSRCFPAAMQAVSPS